MDFDLLRPVVFANLKVGDKLEREQGVKAVVTYVATNFAVLRYKDNIESAPYNDYLEREFRLQPLCWVEDKPVYPGDGPLYYKDNPAWRHNEEGVFASSVRDDELHFHNRMAFPIDTATWTKPEQKREPSFQVEGQDVFPGDTVYYYGDDKHIWGRGMVVEKDSCVNGVHAESFSKGVATFRLKPMLVIGDHLVPMPERHAPAEGTTFFTPDPHSVDYYGSYIWRNLQSDQRFLERGLVHLTKEASIAQGKAVVALSKKRS